MLTSRLRVTSPKREAKNLRVKGTIAARTLSDCPQDQKKREDELTLKKAAKRERMKGVE